MVREIGGDEEPPYSFADRAVTAAQILMEEKLAIFADRVRLLLELGGGKKARLTATRHDIDVLLKIKQSGF